MKHILIYGHGGSYNHGAEASLRCDLALLRRTFPNCRVTLCSHFPEQDRQFEITADDIVTRDLKGQTPAAVYKAAIDTITPDTLCLSIGGDNYCYPNWQRYAAVHAAALARGARSLLWSCSVEPDMLDDEMLQVLGSHHLITVREDVSLRALQDRGLGNVVRVSDIAFALEPEATSLPPAPYVAVNLSPLVLRKNPGLLNAYRRLVEGIISETDWNVALVPHVEVSVDNDAEALAELDGPAARLVRVPVGLRAAQYKYILGNAAFCVAARTHATIAAWSSGVPTLAVGYSAKARGVAADVGQADWVLDASTLAGNGLWNAFTRLTAESDAIRRDLAERISACVERAAGAEASRLLKGENAGAN